VTYTLTLTYLRVLRLNGYFNTSTNTVS